jgi:hypothetical protein
MTKSGAGKSQVLQNGHFLLEGTCILIQHLEHNNLGSVHTRHVNLRLGL